MAQRQSGTLRLVSMLFLAAMLTLGVSLAANGCAWGRDISLIVEGGGKKVSFSADDLLALPQKTIATHTMVTDGVHEFQGPLLRDVLAVGGFGGDMIEATALNDYLSRFPVSDIYDYDVIVAIRMDGQIMSVRDKGPFWIVYPRDDYHELQDMRYDGRWVWQLNRIHVH